MKIEINSFTEEMLPHAGELLAQRHKRNRAGFPLLSARHWRRYGFRDVSYRLSTRVDPMIAWTEPRNVLNGDSEI